MTARPGLTAREAQARNQIARRARALPVPQLLALEPAARLSLTPLPADETHGAPFADADLLTLEWGGARFALSLPAAAADAWLRALLEAGGNGAAVGELDGPWRASARALALDGLCAALSASGRGSARVVAGDGAALAHRFELRLALGGEVIHGRLATDGLGLMLAAGLLAAASPAPGPLAGGLATLPVPVHLSLGHTALPLARLARLRPHDVVLVAEPLAGADGIHHLRIDTAAGAWAFRARHADGSLTVLDTPRPLMTQTSPQTDTPPAGDAPIAFDQLPVRLSFDLGDTTLTLAELQQLQPGEVIALQRPLGGAVTIRANGACIGRGEVVDIDGRCAVAIVELAPPAAALSAPALDDDEA